ncbi:MAG: mandelate racemase/muconate lactonizing enzyme family protein [Pirellulaceae bacterium]|nr:mandelate racemase/muconate lactonizing enzyme family protein [Pirellulaceae bacterium]
MSLPTDLQIRHISTSHQRIAYRTPIKFGGNVVLDALLFDVEVEIETLSGQRARGHGSMPLGNAWSWPSAQVEGEQTLAAMLSLAEAAAAAAGKYQGSGHPLEVTVEMAHSLQDLADDVGQQHQLAEPMPKLAQLVCNSPIEAAIYDAYGRALQQNSYNVLGKEFVHPDLSEWLTSEFQGEYLDRYTTRQTKPVMPLYHLVGALDPLSSSDVVTPVGDGLPETLADWIDADGLTHMKIKLAGDDLVWDVERVVNIEQVATEVQSRRGQKHWWYSCDFNERCANVEYVLDFLGQLREQSLTAWNRVQYIEQPTHRDLRANPENHMHRAAEIKPVVIDESLVDLDSLLLAREQGYSGVALKACKGHSEALLMGAAAQKYNMFLCVQDLTCVGASFLHSASLAARIPTVTAIEGNGRQYCPAGNQGWDTRVPGMFEITDGTVATAELDGIGMGFV